MTATVTSLPAPEWLRDLADARARYEESLGWPVSVQVGRRDLIIIVGGPLGAVGMPANLGARVRQELGFAMLCGPITADPTGTWWTFLTRPVGILRPDVARDLATLRVRILPRGASIDLPLHLTKSPTRGPRWIEPPHPNHTLPPGTAVVSTVRRLTYDDGHLAA